MKIIQIYITHRHLATNMWLQQLQYQQNQSKAGNLLLFLFVYSSHAVCYTRWIFLIAIIILMMMWSSKVHLYSKTMNPNWPSCLLCCLVSPSCLCIPLRKWYVLTRLRKSLCTNPKLFKGSLIIFLKICTMIAIININFRLGSSFIFRLIRNCLSYSIPFHFSMRNIKTSWTIFFAINSF
jgi:hypothetical protein